MAETFANDMANKELIAKIHKQFLLFNIKIFKKLEIQREHFMQRWIQ